MEAHVGDRLTIESNRVGGGTRTGKIVEIIQTSSGPHYRVSWEDGHETVYCPSPGASVAETAR
jgi:uncharacterized protein DUF1918